MYSIFNLMTFRRCFGHGDGQLEVRRPEASEFPHSPRFSLEWEEQVGIRACTMHGLCIAFASPVRRSHSIRALEAWLQLWGRIRAPACVRYRSEGPSPTPDARALGDLELSTSARILEVLRLGPPCVPRKHHGDRLLTTSPMVISLPKLCFRT